MPTVGVEFAKVSYTLPVGADGVAGRVLLRDISLELEAGTTTALLGRSGSGKTTLLRMVNELVTPTSGEVRVAGKATRDYDTVALRRGIGYVIQETGLFPHMTVERNAGMALELAGRSKQEIAARVGEVLALAGFLGYLVLDEMFNIKAALLQDMGRNATLTGRTDVWRVLLNVGTDPILGTGFMSFWDDPWFQSKLPYWVAFSAHNGYIEIFLCGGIVGICFLAVMLFASGIRINRALAVDGDYGVVRFAIFIVALLANYTETNIAWLTPVDFLFLIAVIGHAEAASLNQRVDEPMLTTSPDLREAGIQAGGSPASVHS